MGQKRRVNSKTRLDEEQSERIIYLINKYQEMINSEYPNIAKAFKIQQKWILSEVINDLSAIIDEPELGNDSVVWQGRDE